MNNLEIANAIRENAQSAIIDFEILEKARQIVAGIHEGLPIDEIGELMFDYSFTLSAKVATGVAYAVMGEEKFDQMTDDIMEHELNNFLESLENN